MKKKSLYNQLYLKVNFLHSESSIIKCIPNKLDEIRRQKRLNQKRGAQNFRNTETEKNLVVSGLFLIQNPVRNHYKKNRTMFNAVSSKFSSNGVSSSKLPTLKRAIEQRKKFSQIQIVNFEEQQKLWLPQQWKILSLTNLPTVKKIGSSRTNSHCIVRVNLLSTENRLFLSVAHFEQFILENLSGILTPLDFETQTFKLTNDSSRKTKIKIQLDPEEILVSHLLNYRFEMALVFESLQITLQALVKLKEVENDSKMGFRVWGPWKSGHVISATTNVKNTILGQCREMINVQVARNLKQYGILPGKISMCYEIHADAIGTRNAITYISGCVLFKGMNLKTSLL